MPKRDYSEELIDAFDKYSLTSGQSKADAAELARDVAEAFKLRAEELTEEAEQDDDA